MGDDDIADFVAANVVDPIARVPGVGNVQAFGTQYAMRIWLDPGKLETYRLTPDDVIAQIRAQNQQVAIGELGGSAGDPRPAAQCRDHCPGTPAEAGGVPRHRAARQPRRLLAAARRRGPRRTRCRGLQHREPLQRPARDPASPSRSTSGANSIATSRAVEATLEQLKLAFPPGLKAVVPFDTTPFVRVAIQGVILTLLEAIALVFLVMYLFLQNLRATLIPTIAVPVVLLGTFAVLAALGYSVNMLTMFAMVLAIGLLVDDAIVVVENVERVMRDEGLSAVEATRKSMDQITGALVGIGLVLAAVFVPMAFLTGSTGIIYRQFSATIVSAMALSVLVALVLTPALCATLLKPADAQAHASAGGFFGWFNRTLRPRQRAARRTGPRNAFASRAIHGRLRRDGRADDRAVPAPAERIPAAGRPGLDAGAGDCAGRRDAAAHDEGDRRGREALPETSRQVQVGLHRAGLQLRRQRPEYRHRVDQPEGLVGAQVAGDGRPGRRRARDGRADADQGRVRLRVRPAPAARARHRRRGFVFYLTDNAGLGREALVAARNQFLGAAAQSKLLANVRPNGLEDAPQLRIRTRPRQVGGARTPRLRHQRHARAPPGAASTSTTSWTGDASSACTCSRTHRSAWCRRTSTAGPCATRAARWCRSPPFATWDWEFGSPRLERYNGTPALEINGERGARRELGHRDGRGRATRRAAAARHRSRSGPASPTRSAPRARRRRCSTRSRCSSCSCASRRCTRAGRSPPPCCSSCPSASSARCSRPRCAAWSVTSTSRSRCSRRWASPARTRS